MTKRDIQNFISSRTAKLAATYLAIIMLMSISFSAVFYLTSANRLQGRPMPPTEQISPQFQDGFVNEDIEDYILKRFEQTRQDLLLRLIWLNIGALAIGSLISYILARASLRPIEDAMESQAQFVSDASHELRTPLAVLQTTNEVVLRKKEISEEVARDLISHNVVEVEKLKNLSNALLELLKSDNENKPKLKKVNLDEVIKESVSEFAEQSKQSGIRIKTQTTKLSAVTNKMLLIRLVSVLLDNAIKYSEPEKEIEISASTDGAKVKLSIIDQGHGIKASDIPYIFKRFYRADKSRVSDNVSGYGLGLSIADKIAKQLNAKINVESEIGKGSTFTIILDTAS